MAYMAMARKWRPRNFEEMVGQDHIAQTIRNAIEGQRISHAYLFTGTRGVGKTTSARILAKALNCKQGPTPVPCDACDNCKAVTNGNSMDVLEIDGASNNSVDNIRELREQVNYAPMNGKYKIYVIDEVHMLSKSAFNALLKTLEEPPAHVVFIFATTESNKVPHTILSRVQRFDFKRISEADIRGRLEYICGQEGIKPEREALDAVARKADGSMRDALSLFDQVYAYSGADLTFAAARKVLGLPRDEIFDALLRALIDHDQKACFNLLQDAHREGVETAELLIAFGEHLRNLLFARQGVAAAALGLGEARRDELASQAPELKDGDILRFGKLVSDLLAALKTAANPRLAVELGFARMAALDRTVTLSQLLGQIGSDPAPAAPVTSKLPSGNGNAKDGAPGSAGIGEERTRRSEATEGPLADPTYLTGTTPGGASKAAPAPAAPTSGDFADEDPGGSKKKTPVLSNFTVTDTPTLPPAPGASVPDRGPVAAPSPAVSAASASASAAPAPFAAMPSAAATPAAAPHPESSRVAVAESPHAAPIGPETELEIEPEYPPESDDADLPMEAYAAAPTARTPEKIEDEKVSPQEEPESFCGLWPRLVSEYADLRPMLGGHLMHSRLEWSADDVSGTPGLNLILGDRAAFSLIGEDADFRKGMQAFLASKLKAKRDFALRISLDEAAASAAAPPVTQVIPRDGIDGIMLREPIVRIVRDLFDGRVLNP